MGDFCGFFGFLGGFRGREAFRGVSGGCGSVLTKFGLKRRHLDLIHARFDDFGHISMFNTHIFLCSTHTICLCATETAVSAWHTERAVSVCHTETAVSVCHTETAVSVWRTHTAVRAGGRRAAGAGRRAPGGRANSTPTGVHPHPRKIAIPRCGVHCARSRVHGAQC